MSDHEKDPRLTTKQLDAWLKDIRPATRPRAWPDVDPAILRAVKLIDDFQALDPSKTARVRRLAREALYLVVDDYRTAMPSLQRLDRALNQSTDPHGTFHEAFRREWRSIHDQREKDREDWIRAGRPGQVRRVVDPLQQSYEDEIKIMRAREETYRQQMHTREVASLQAARSGLTTRLEHLDYDAPLQFSVKVSDGEEAWQVTRDVDGFTTARVNGTAQKTWSTPGAAAEFIRTLIGTEAALQLAGPATPPARTGQQVFERVQPSWRAGLAPEHAVKVPAFLAARGRDIIDQLDRRRGGVREGLPVRHHRKPTCHDETSVEHDDFGPVLVRVTCDYDPKRAAEHKKFLMRWRPHAEAWHEVLEAKVRKLGLEQEFATGLLFCNEDKALTTLNDGQMVVYLQPEFFQEAIDEDPSPYAVAKYIDGAADHEIAHWDLMGHGHTTEWAAVREDVGAKTGGMFPEVLEIVESMMRMIPKEEGCPSARRCRVGGGSCCSSCSCGRPCQGLEESCPGPDRKPEHRALASRRRSEEHMTVPLREKYETRAALAASRRSRSAELTHTAEIGDEGWPVRVLCNRIELDNLADEYACNVNARPTCKVCASRDPRFKLQPGSESLPRRTVFHDRVAPAHHHLISEGTKAVGPEEMKRWRARLETALRETYGMSAKRARVLARRLADDALEAYQTAPPDTDVWGAIGKKFAWLREHGLDQAAIGELANEAQDLAFGAAEFA